MSGARYAALLLLLLVAAFPFAAPYVVPLLVQERILRFHSDILVRDDHALLVSETIEVRATGDEVQRGIYRDFPTDYRAADGRTVSVPFEVLDVQRDGRREPYRVVGRENGKRVYIGQEDVFLSPGTYTYRLTYRTDRQVGRFPTHTELYWNVTGNGWTFPIDRASAAISLPREAAGTGVALTAYSGRAGSRDRHARHGLREGLNNPVAWFETTRPLGAQQGLTVVAAWPPPVGGTLQPAGAFDWLLARPDRALGALGAGALLLYYLGVWRAVGKDPPRGSGDPRYEPPEDLSPAAVRYLRRMGADDKTFAAAAISLAVKGHLRIEQAEGAYTLRRTGENAGALPAPEEFALASQLFADGEAVSLTSEQHTRVSAARQALRAALEPRYGRGYFRRNGPVFWLGVVASAPLLVAVAILAAVGEGRSPLGGLALAFGAFLLLMPLAVALLVFLGSMAARRMRTALLGGPGRLGAPFEAAFLTAFGLGVALFGAVGLYALALETSEWAIATWAAVAGLHVLFGGVMPAFTPAGRALLDQVEAFREYLASSAREQLELLTPALFERHLPYAVALDVENAWAEHFNTVLGRSGFPPSATRADWYDRHSWRNDQDVCGVAASLGDAFAGAISSAASPPGSSSGSSGGSDSGGGSSGGGGGGGGGGGW